MGTLTFCNKNFLGDIPRHEVETVEEATDLLYHWIGMKKQSVFVVFEKIEELDLEVLDLFISECQDATCMYCDHVMELTNIDKLYLGVFEFNDFQEAFEFCQDMKE